jgi:DNA-binding MarR family transcriptional regulator
MSAPLPCACTTLRKASRAVSRLYDERLAGSGMTITQFAMLRHISREDGIALSHLADLLVMERTSLYRTIAPLERHGWVAIATAGSGRVKHASLTDAGRDALAGATGAWEATQSEVLQAIGVDSFRALEAQLRALVTISGRLAS